MPDRNLPHRNHLFLAAITRILFILRRQRRHALIIPRLRTLSATLIYAIARLTAPERTRSRMLFDVREAFRSGAVASVTAAERFGAYGGEDLAEERPEQWKTGGENADVAFDVQPDAGVYHGIWIQSVRSEGLRRKECTVLQDTSLGSNCTRKGIRTMLPTAALGSNR